MLHNMPDAIYDVWYIMHYTAFEKQCKTYHIWYLIWCFICQMIHFMDDIYCTLYALNFIQQIYIYIYDIYIYIKPMSCWAIFCWANFVERKQQWPRAIFVCAQQNSPNTKSPNKTMFIYICIYIYIFIYTYIYYIYN